MKTVFSILLVAALVFSSSQGGQRKNDGHDKKAAKSAEVQTRPPKRAAERPSREVQGDQQRRTKPDPQQNPARSEVKTRHPETTDTAEREYRPSTEQDPWERIQPKEGQTGRIRADHRNVFEDVRTGLKSGRMNSFSDLLGPQVHMSLRGGESGYFSSSQAYYVLENYLRENKFSEIDFTTMEQSGDMPYATGKASFDHNGVHDAAQVYVSLSQVGERWVISQIKIY